MKLVNAGLGRTGTTSLKVALEAIGFAPIYHSTDLLINPKHMDIWERGFQGQSVDWRTFYAPYAVADWPAALFYKDIIDTHPEAKVLITVRDPEQWFESISSVYRQVANFHLPLPHLRRVKRFMEIYAANKFFGGNIHDKEHMVQFFEQYIERVRQCVPAERLLIYNVVEGWEPLCRFLEVDVPRQPFPRANTRENFKDLATTLLTGLKN